MSSHGDANSFSSEDRIVQSIYEHIVSSVCIDVARNMHELIKTGEIPASELKAPSSREEIYPELYKGKTPDEVKEILEKYATEQPTTSRSRKRKLPGAANSTAATITKPGGVENDSDEDFQEPSTTEDQPAGEQAIDHLDIWGKLPPKEPKQTCECRLCGRHVSALRFAPHLDKCMGLSTARGSTGNATRNSVYAAGNTIK
eukprot:scaffold1194_cov127-Cylindrotheca_fusiformis.AAC.14